MAILSKGTTYADGDQITSTNLNALVDSATFASGAVESGGGVQLNGSGQLKVGGNVDIGTSNLTATGTISLGATSFNDNDITNVGSIALDTITNDGTDVTIDSSGDIILDADGAQVRIKDAGTERFVFNTDATPELDVTGGDFTIHANTSDADIIFTGNDGGSTITALTLDMSAAGAATFNDKITAVGTSVFTNLDISGDVDIDGTINLDAVDIDGNVQIDGTVTVGVDDTGYDVKFFGATSGAYIQFDASADKLLTAGGATIDIVKDKLLIGGTAVTTTAAELNVLNGVTAGTVTASKGIVVDSNKDIASFRNITLTGELDAGSLDVSGDADIDGTLETDALSIASTAVTATAAELNYNDTGASVGTVVASKTVTVDSNKDVSGFRNVSLETLTNATTDFTIDSSGDIVLDAGGADIRLKDDGSQFGRFANSSSNLIVASSISDKDILFNGSDGGVQITALTLDMSAAGAATFNDKITAVGTSVFTNLDISGDIDVDGTTNLDAVDIDGAVDMASTLTVADDANFDSGTLFVDASADRVGIGTTSPSHKLHLSEGSTDFAALIANSTSSGNGLKINAGDNSGDRILQLNDKDGNEKLRVGATGLVGVNNASPSSTLDVTGTLAISGDTVLNSDLEINVVGSSNGSKAIVINSSGTNFESDDGMIRLLHPSTGSGALTGGYFMKFNANSSDKFTVKGNGDTAIAGALSKGSGSFKIAHPLESKRDTHNLVHSFLEGPQADLLYRGRVDLVDGVASVNIDTASDMTDGTFVLLCRDVQSFTTNESGWTAVRSSVEGNILTIEAQDNTCTDSISWMVVGERQDEHMYETEWTDESGKVIVEPLIPEPTPEPEPEEEPTPEAEEETTEE